ncbi:MAG: malonic semialdehyde reductase [Chromatiaceae bacterium]|jgi:3-hydroxypropanoate dehydrogenase|nr:malonic semialdehyde reductase [Chromatiaceae bacterium]
MKQPLDANALDQLFRTARTFPSWQGRSVTDQQLTNLYDLLKWGPTSMNCLPGRFVFLRTPEAKARLAPWLMAGNVEKVRQAPVTVIVAHDTRFYEHLPRLWPHSPDARDMFASNSVLAESTAFRNGTLQGAYLILAARALGLDVGPMSGFDNAKVDAEFFPDGRFRSNFLANIGYGEESGLHPRLPRLALEEAVELV